MATKEKIILWLPRLLCIGAILFVSMFALDAFEPGIPFGQQLLNFLMHLIPTCVLLLLLWISWKKPFWGGILFAIIGIVTSPLVYNLNYNRTHSVMTSLSIILMITVPFIVIGILFMMSHKQEKKIDFLVNLQHFKRIRHFYRKWTIRIYRQFRTINIRYNHFLKRRTIAFIAS